MFEKLRLLIALLHQGSEVANVSKWHKHQITAAKIVAIVAILVALLKSFGVTVPLSDADQASIGVALYALVNWLLTVIASPHVGLPPKPSADPVPAPSGDTDPQPMQPEPAPATDTKSGDEPYQSIG